MALYSHLSIKGMKCQLLPVSFDLVNAVVIKTVKVGDLVPERVLDFPIQAIVILM